MKQARMLGSYVEELAKRNNVPLASLEEILNCDDHKLRRFFKGRTFASFSQMQAVANLLNVSILDLLEGDKESYKANIVHCNQNFDNDDNREKILDIINDYMDLYEAVELDRMNEKGGESDA